jgi:hypothetical protein
MVSLLLVGRLVGGVVSPVHEKGCFVEPSLLFPCITGAGGFKGCAKNGSVGLGEIVVYFQG